MAENKRQNVIENVSFSWVPDVFKVKWASSPKEVPVWDWSRGFPLSHNLHWTSGKYIPVSPQLSGNGYGSPTSRTAELANHNLVIEDNDSVTYYIRKTLKDVSWLPKPPPENGYPRLVRADPRDYGKMVGADDDVVNAITALVKDRRNRFDLSTSWKLQKQILSLTEKYGLLNDEQVLSGNTYQAWLLYAYHVQAAIDALEALNINGFDALPTFFASEHDRWLSDLEIQNVLEPYAKSPYFMLSRTLEGNAEEFAKEMTRQCFQFFSHNCRIDIATNLGATLVHAPLENWVQYQLGHLWIGNRMLKTCEGCGRLYIARRRNMKCCSSACRQRKSSNLK